MILPRPHRRRMRCHEGTKTRNFAPLPDLSLEELVPEDNFYRRLETTLDLSFVRVESRLGPRLSYIARFSASPHNPWPQEACTEGSSKQRPAKPLNYRMNKKRGPW